jgi:uncharacterized repeat protein (TIGR01451 family)
VGTNLFQLRLITPTRQKNNGGRDAFVSKFNTTLSGSSSLVYSTFLGGSTDEKAWAIAVDTNGNACVAGEIKSFNNVFPAPPTSDFPTLNAFEPLFNQGSTNSDAGSEDGFVTRLSADGTALVFSTYLGGGDDDFATGLTIDATGRIYVAGQSASSDFITTTNAAQPVNAGLAVDPNFPGFDAFVTVFQPNGALYYSTLFGGSLDESGFDAYPTGVAVDRFGMIYLAGQTQSSDFPTTVGADITNTAASSDMFIAKINPLVSGSNAIVYCSLFSGDLDTGGSIGAANYLGGVAVDTNANFFLGGTTTATNFQVTVGAFDSTYNGGFYDAVVGKFSSPRDISVTMFPSLEPVIAGSNFIYAIQVNNNGGNSFTGVTNKIRLSTNVQVLSITTSAGTYTTNYNSTNGWLVAFNLGTLTSYSAVTQNITLKTVMPGVTTNVATLTSLEGAAGLEPNTVNNVANIPNTILGVVDVKINSLAQPVNPVPAGSNFIYTIVVGNKGQTASSITVTDLVPAQVTLNWATNSQATFCFVDVNNGIVTCTLANLTNGGTATVAVGVTASTLGTGTNSVGAIPFDYDSNMPNNFATLGTTVVVGPVRILSPAKSGGNFIFSFQTFSNQSYTIQQNTNLLTTNWTLFSNFIGNGSIYQFSVPLSSSRQKFFRVREP